jgi:hypothetical protein
MKPLIPHSASYFLSASTFLAIFVRSNTTIFAKGTRFALVDIGQKGDDSQEKGELRELWTQPSKERFSQPHFGGDQMFLFLRQLLKDTT